MCKTPTHPQPGFYETIEVPAQAQSGEPGTITHRTVERIAASQPWQPPAYDLDSAWDAIVKRHAREEAKVPRQRKRRAAGA